MNGEFRDGVSAAGKGDPARFDTTNWSLVLGVLDTAPQRVSQAMERLCSRYWQPVHGFIRRQVCDPHQAEDLTQAFFAFVIEHQVFSKARQERGRFRNFLLSSLKHFLLNQHARDSSLKRGGGQAIVPLGETLTGGIAAPAPDAPFGDGFDREWALGLVRRTLDDLRTEAAGRGRLAIHDALVPFLTRRPGPDESARLAETLRMEPAALRVALHRLRVRFGERLRREVAQTVADPDEVAEELRYLVSVIADG